MSDDMPSVSSPPISYLQKFQLTREPFAHDPNSSQDDFFLLDSERAQRLNMLYHMSQNSELLLVVTGIEGSGKTSLLHRFIEMRTENWRHCVIDANTMTNPDQLLIEIAEGFGLPQDSVNFGSGLEMLQKRLTEMKLSELMPILIIDDAHELPTASLLILLKLSELSEGDERLLRIVLFAEPNIMEMFDAPELKEVRHRITHTLTMPLLTEQQSIDYIHYRLSIAGLQGDCPFSHGQLKRIHRQANGVPGLINKFAQEILLGTTMTQHSSPLPSITMRLRSLMSVFIILGVAGAITWYLSRDVINSLNDTQSEKIAGLETRELPLLPPSSKASRELKDTSQDSIPSETIVTAASENNTDKITSSVEKTTKTDITPTAVPSKSELTTEHETATAPTTQTIEPNIIKPVSVDNEDPVKTPAEAVTEITSAVKQPVDIVAPRKPIATTPAASVQKDWLSLQNKNHFTLQLMGSGQRSPLVIVQNKHKIGSQSAIIRTKRNDKDWYILVYKAYPTKQQARNAANILPKALRLTQPWPRRLSDIKSAK